MQYWKDGFFSKQSPENDRYEITDVYWQELLEGQSDGKVITSDNNGKPILTDRPPPIEIDLKEMRLFELNKWFKWYDIEVIKSVRKKTDISELHEQAESNANELNELKIWLNNN